MPGLYTRKCICVVDIENPAMVRERQVKIYEFAIFTARIFASVW
jgi:hypothetical protein